MREWLKNGSNEAPGPEGWKPSIIREIGTRCAVFAQVQAAKDLSAMR
jgi:hypothetical protein